MTDKPSREDVLRLAGDPVACMTEDGLRVATTVTKDTAMSNPSKDAFCIRLYTESQVLAMYAAGAEAMRERADDAWADAIQSDCEHGVKLLSEKSALKLRNEYPALAKLGETIRSIPITTNTEGEQA